MARIGKTAVVLAIVAFWAVMTGWLIQANRGQMPFSELPPRQVLRQILQHEVTSTLGIYRGPKRIGSVTVTPVHAPSDAISLDGTISLPEAGGMFSFSIRIDLEKSSLRPELITLRLSRRQPALNALVEVLLREQKIRYHLRSGDEDLGTQELPLSAGALAAFAPDLAGLPALPISAGSLLKSLETRANRTRFPVRGERIEGFVVEISEAGMSATVTIGQLGEIFFVSSSTEYQLVADGLEWADRPRNTGP